MGATSDLTVPGCTNALYSDVNPFWYTFTCFKEGTLAFVITPNNLKDDYDWMLYDITGHLPVEVLTNPGLVVIGNWSGSSGLTGAKRGGSYKTECASDPTKEKISTFSTTPNLKEGHKYLLLVSHYTQTQSGYSLSFGGGTAVITDPLQPHLKSARIACDRKSITVLLNKQMRCSSLTAEGSEFAIGSNLGTIVSAKGGCNSGFDMDSILLTLNAPLAPGNYTLLAKTGSDGNTLLDDCDTEIPMDEMISFEVLPPHATPFDSLKTPACAPSVVQLVFSDPILCSSIVPDGSDFRITGSTGAAILKAEGVCSNGYTSVINITFSAPIVQEGNFLISLVRGSDGNSIINECGVETVPGAQLAFSTKDTVSAAFDYSIIFGCKTDTISVNYLFANGVNSWLWIIDSIPYSNLPETKFGESIFGPKMVQHVVSNGFCSDTVSQIVDLDNTLKAGFAAADFVCPKDVLAFSNTSIGKIVTWDWDFGDGTSSIQKDPPPHLFPDTWAGKDYIVSLAIVNDLGCKENFSQKISKLQSCYITVPNGFSPDGNGINDYLYPLNAFTVTNLEFMVYNRFGQLVFESRDWRQKWDGTINGKQQPVGTYVWTLKYTDGSSGKRFSTRGTSVLIR